MAALGQTISGVAHELNNPLATILSWAERLSEKSLDDELRRGVDVILGEADRAARIVRNLLTFARKRPSTRTMIDINQVVAETLALRAHEQQLIDIEVATSLALSLPQIFADAHQIQQVLLNLVMNAEQAMRVAHGRGALVVRTWHDTEQDVLALEVSDDGPGVPVDVQSRIFDPFFTTKGVGKGTGLGVDVKHVVHSGGLLEAGPRRSPPETRMGTLPVVVVQIAGERSRARVRCEIGPAIGPLAQERLNEALGLAVGAGRVGPRALVLHHPAPTRGRPDPRAIATTIVREDAVDADATAGKPLQRPAQKAGARVAPLRPPHLHVGEPRGIIDGHMDVPPAARLRPLAIAGHAVADAPDTAQGLDVHVQQVAGVRPLIAADDGPGLEHPQPIQAGLAQDAGDGRARHLQCRTDLPRGRARLSELHDLADGRHSQAPGLSMGPRCGIETRQVPGAPAGHPLRDGPDADARRLGGARLRPVLAHHAVDDQLTH